MIADFPLGLMCTADILLCKRTTGGGLEWDTPAACSHVGSGQDGNINNFYMNSHWSWYQDKRKWFFEQQQSPIRWSYGNFFLEKKKKKLRLSCSEKGFWRARLPLLLHQWSHWLLLPSPAVLHRYQYAVFFWKLQAARFKEMTVFLEHLRLRIVSQLLSLEHVHFQHI